MEISLLISLASCYKDSRIFTPDQNFDINNEILLTELIGGTDSYVINTGSEHFIPISNTHILIPNQKFYDHEGQVINGNINLQFRELTEHKKDMLLCPSTITSNQLIQAEKVFHISLTKNDKKLSLSEPIVLYLESENEVKGIRLFSHNNGSEEFQWDIPEGSMAELVYGEWELSPSKMIKGYKIALSNHSDWFMLGRPFDNAIHTPSSLEVEVPKIYNNRNTLVYFMGNDINFIQRLFYDSHSKRFIISTSPQMEAMDGIIVLLSQLESGKHHFGMNNVVLGNDTKVTINPNQKSTDEIKAILNSL